jgi:hypothetical protein
MIKRAMIERTIEAAKQAYQQGIKDGVASASGWQPIETAPKNASVLIFIPNVEHYGPGIYRAMLVDMGTGPHWSANAVAMGHDLGRDTAPTHWMPLPSPPQEKG